MSGDAVSGETEGSDAVLAKAVGAELWRTREAQGLNRTQVVQRMDGDISAQALANYEYGIRPCPVARFVLICEALDTPAMDLLGLALQRAGIHPYTNILQIDLNALAETDSAPWALRRWASHKLAIDTGDGIAHLEQAVVQELAHMLGISRDDLVHRLLQVTPDVTPRWARQDPAPNRLRRNRTFHREVR